MVYFLDSLFAVIQSHGPGYASRVTVYGHAQPFCGPFQRHSLATSRALVTRNVHSTGY
jgi:hypothetical protein